MPKVTADIERVQLFTDEDPLEIDIPQVGTWRLSNYDVNPPSDDLLGKPVTYVVTMLALQAWEDPEDEAAGRTPNADEMVEKIVDAVEAGTIHVTVVGEVLEDVRKLQEKARKAATSKASGRPTKRRSR